MWTGAKARQCSKSKNDDKKWDWLKDQHPERGRAIDEILKRADFGHGPLGKVSHIIRSYDTNAERFRDYVFDNAPQHIKKFVEDNTQDDKPLTPESKRRKIVRAFIRDLSPHQGSKQRRKEKTIFKIIKKACARNKIELTKSRKESKNEFNKIKALFNQSGPLDPNPKLERDYLIDEGRETVKPLAPYPPGDAAYKYWLNLWRKPEDSKAEPEKLDRELRLFWEGYFDRQHYVVWEDFKTDKVNRSPISPKGHNFFISNETSKPINANSTAFDSFLDWKQAWEDDGKIKDFEWKGKLLNVSHFWTANIFNLKLDCNEGEIKEGISNLKAGKLYCEAAENLLTEIIKFSLNSFPQRDQTRLWEQRDDLVISLLGHGEAVLICDFRPYSRNEDEVGASNHKERATRVLIISLRAGENEIAEKEKIGRLVRRCLDISTLRMLALRDYQYIFPILDVLDSIRAEISKLESGSLTDKSQNDLASISRRLDTWLELSERLSALNHFINGGITGFYNTATENLKIIEQHLADLKETSVTGHQSLDGYLRRFRASVALSETVYKRYEAVRDRLDEMVNLNRAELQRLSAKRASKLAKIALLISGLILLQGILTLIDIFFPQTSMPFQTWLLSAWHGLLISLLTGLIIGVVTRWIYSKALSRK